MMKRESQKYGKKLDKEIKTKHRRARRGSDFHSIENTYNLLNSNSADKELFRSTRVRKKPR